MSAETQRALEEAFAAHVADELDGAMLVNFVGIAAAVKPADSVTVTHYLRAASDQPLHVSLGLSEYLANRLSLLAVADGDEELGED